MQRPLFIAAFVLLASVALSAQHGGGHASAGGHGFSGGHGSSASHGGFAGHVGGGHAFSGTHSSSGHAGRSFRQGSSFHGPLSSRGFNRGFRHFDRGGVRFRSYGYGRNCYWNGCGWGYPYLGGGIDPYWWWNNNDSSFDYDQQYQTGLANEMNQQSLEEQRMRQQGDQDIYVRSAPPPPHQAEPIEAVPATVLVFRDEHKQEIHNYAIVGQTLWNFNPQHTQKIPLADLDIPATAKANEDRGVDFRLPGAHEGQ